MRLNTHARHLWATISTISGNGDAGADPNRLVAIRDTLKNSDAAVAAQEKFITLRTANFAEVLRGISFTPDRDADDRDHDHR